MEENMETSKNAQQIGGTQASQGIQAQQKVTYKNMDEYIEALRQWMMQYHSWCQTQMYFQTMPHYMMGYMAAQQTFSRQPQPNLVNQFPTQTQNTAGVGAGQAQGENNLRQNPINQNIAPPNQRAVHIQREFRIAPVWKRVTAELIDFFLLFMMKLAVTIVAVEHMGLIDLDKYDIELEKLFSQNIDYNVALGLTTELVALEVINRVCITLFETLCLRRGVAGMIGGTTPGKRSMGIRVVACEDVVVELGNGLVRVTPATDIGVWNALVRSVIKNFSLAFFFPVCFTALFFQHHRAAYDVIANCIVVEPVPQPQRR